MDIQIESDYLKPSYSFGKYMVINVTAVQGGMGETYRCLEWVSHPNKKLQDELIRLFSPRHYLNVANLELDKCDPNSPNFSAQYARSIKGRIPTYRQVKDKCEQLLAERVFESMEDIEKIKKELGIGPEEANVRFVLGKYLSDEIARTEASIDIAGRFEREITLYSRLPSHTNIAYFHGTFYDKEGSWLIAEFIDGTNLKTISNNPARWAKPLTPIQASVIALKVAKGLSHIHEHGIIHNDIKPSNIMIQNKTNEVKLTDFGIATELDEKITESRTTQHYASPAQARFYLLLKKHGYDLSKVDGIILDPTSDLFSLGVLFYELLTGEKPFVDLHGISWNNIADPKFRPKPIRLHYKEKFYRTPQEEKKFREMGYNYSKEVERICSKMLEKSPDDTYQSAEEAVSDLADFLAKEGIREVDRNKELEGLIFKRKAGERPVIEFAEFGLDEAEVSYIRR